MIPNPRSLLFLSALGAVLLCGCRPPAADLKEAYAQDKSKTAHVDHAALDRVLKRFVSPAGQVDYAGLKKDSKDLGACIAMLGKVKFEQLGRDEKLALLINAYNAFTLALILDHYPLKSIKDIPEAKRWKERRWHIGTLTLSLDQIEHEYLRPKFREPRIHFAVNCASIGCPPLRTEVYTAKKIEAQLQAQAIRMHEDPRWFELDAKAGTLKLTRLYDWFAGDFQQVAGSTLEFAARFRKDLADLLKAGKKPTVTYLDYDWRLNGK